MEENQEESDGAANHFRSVNQEACADRLVNGGWRR